MSKKKWGKKGRMTPHRCGARGWGEMWCRMNWGGKNRTTKIKKGGIT